MHLSLLSLFLFLLVAPQKITPDPVLDDPAHYICRRTEGQITIDGRLDESVWKDSEPSAPFVDIVDGKRAWHESRVALLWDDANLYLGFTLEEPDGRSLPPRPGDIWRIDCSRFQHFDRRGKVLRRSAGWTWNRHGYYDSHMPERFTFVEFSSELASAPQQGIEIQGQTGR